MDLRRTETNTETSWTDWSDRWLELRPIWTRLGSQRARSGVVSGIFFFAATLPPSPEFRVGPQRNCHHLYHIGAACDLEIRGYSYICFSTDFLDYTWNHPDLPMPTSVPSNFSHVLILVTQWFSHRAIQSNGPVRTSPLV